MATKKITLNELRNLVKQIIKEEENNENQILLKVLKPIKFEYIGETYLQNRYLTDDNKFFITEDKLNFVKIYKANSDGKGALARELYDRNPSSYPFYNIRDAVKKAYTSSGTFEYTFNVNDSQYSNKKPIIINI